MRSSILLRLVAVAGAGSLALSACGGDDDDGGDKKDPGAQAAAKGDNVDGVLSLGTILPRTGDLAFLGPPMFASADLGVKEVNAAGGVLGKKVAIIHKDSGDDKTNIASQSVESLLQQKADVILGAAASGVSFNVIDRITGSGRLQFSPANTSDRFTTYNDKGLYFRTAPPDKLQGRVLGNLIGEEDNESVYILNRQDAYGTGLAENVEKTLKDAGVETAKKAYASDAQEFSAEVTEIKAKKPDAIALITFEEMKKIGPELIKQGLSPDKVKWYLVDGNVADYSKDKAFKKGQLRGVKGTVPGAAAPDAFRTRLKQINPKLKDWNYAPEAYDAVVLTALAAEAAKNDDAKAIAGKLREVSAGGDKCDTYKECLDLLKKGKDVDFDGVSGPIEFNDAGDPTEATIGIYQYQANNNHKNVKYDQGKLEE